MLSLELIIPHATMVLFCRDTIMTVGVHMLCRERYVGGRGLSWEGFRAERDIG